jgi:hypothetical protein
MHQSIFNFVFANLYHCRDVTLYCHTFFVLFLSKTTKLNLLVSLHEEVCIYFHFIYHLLFSLSFFISLSLNLSLSLFFSLSLSFSLSLFLYFSLSFALFFSLFLSLFLSFSLSCTFRQTKDLY